ncbi:MAG: hypothetical protein JWM68_731 [Verrucomicrobiales bacterium]|nr:hypothetical protein [Verrucomicrobiales bacterium]
MSKLELGFLIRAALRHTLQQQEKLLRHNHVVELLPVIQKLAQFTLELEKWYSSKYHLKDRCEYFIREAEKIEAEADCISEKMIWSYAPVSIVPIFHKIRDRQTALRNEQSYPKQLRTQFNNFRLGLLEQIAGARLLENNSDLGDEVERILVQYLNRRLGGGVRVLRGGHIYDYENNRSGQIDIIITPANALGFCPADTDDGKYNVMIDQVIAAISVTSRLSIVKLRERRQQLQGIPDFKQKAQNYPSLQDQPWPLCYIVAAESDDDLDTLWKKWDETGSPDDKHPLQMGLLLDSGYIRATTSFYPAASGEGLPEKVHDVMPGDEIYAGLGLGWLEVQIARRNCILTNQTSDWAHRLSKQLSNLELREASPPTYDKKRDRWLFPRCSVHGVLTTTGYGKWAHNKLLLFSIYIDEKPLLNPTKPIPREKYLRYDFEPRWFKVDVKATNGDYCALEEWTDSTDHENHQRRIVVFNSRTGAEVTDKLPRPLNDCSELEKLNPSDFPQTACLGDTGVSG